MIAKGLEDFGGLERVAAKQGEWATLPVLEKKLLLEEMLAIVSKIGYEPFLKVGNDATKMMGIPTTTSEGQYESALQSMIFISLLADLRTMLEIFKIRCGEKSLDNLETRKAINGQVCVKTFPFLAHDKTSPLAGCTGEVWMDSSVKDEQDVKPLSYNQIEQEDGGAMVVLGAGNHGHLGLGDCLHGLFMKNCVVYLKHHPSRSYVDELARTLFAPLIAKGFMDMEHHVSNDRSSKLINHPVVTNVHITGGKATHDAIVWGATAAEQAKNRSKNTPALKAKMTSELGAVSPWVVVPAKYTSKELQDQAGIAAFWIHNNASCNCNAPKVICVSEEWEQKEEFLGYIETSLANHMLPVAYYSGIKSRWRAFRDQYPEAKILDSNSGLGIKERQLLPPLLGEEACLLPYLQIHIDVDLSSDQGRKAAKSEYAFLHEPFAPVYTIVTMKNTGSLASFCKMAAIFCNDYLFGSLSGSVTLAPSVKSSVECQTLISDLKYGSLGINCWGGGCYGFQLGGWGAFPGESLDNVESGIDRIHNMLFLPNMEKCTLEAPIVSPTHIKLKQDLEKETKVFQAVMKMQIAPGVLTTIGVLAAVFGVDLMTVGVGFGAAVTAITAIIAKRALSK